MNDDRSQSRRARLANLLVVTLAAITSFGMAAQAWAAPRVIITIDVESIDSRTLPKQVDTRCQGDSDCGLMGIARLLKERSMPGTFFLNVYEYRKWGEPLLRGITERLQAEGQDVALHTHPQWAYDRDRNEMFQYSIDEQTEIVRDGARLLSSWTGLPVVAHRAGNYSADVTTLEALRRNGILVDSSLFWGHPSSRIASGDAPSNVPSMLGGLIQIPVTIYHREARPAWTGSWIDPVRTVRKIDPDWFVDVAEARAAMDAATDAGLPFVVVFMHSFTLIEPGDEEPFARDERAQRILVGMLDYIAEKNLEVVTMRQLAAEQPPSFLGRADVIPGIAVTIPPHRYVAQVWRSTGAVEKGALVMFVICCLAGVGAMWVRHRRRVAR